MQKSNANLLWLHCLANRVALSKFSFILSTGDRTIIPFLLQNAMHFLHFLHKNNKNKKQAHILFHCLPFAVDLFFILKQELRATTNFLEHNAYKIDKAPATNASLQPEPIHFFAYWSKNTLSLPPKLALHPEFSYQSLQILR